MCLHKSRSRVAECQAGNHDLYMLSIPGVLGMTAGLCTGIKFTCTQLTADKYPWPAGDARLS